jgi:hypothetical protein
MDLFGFKRRKAERERNARIRAEALDNAIKTVQRRPSVAEDEADRTSGRDRLVERRPVRRPYRPEADRSDTGLYGGGLYPHSSSSGMATDMNYASYANDPATSRSDDSASKSHDSLGAAGSGAFGDSGAGGYTSPSSGWSDSSSSSGSGSSSSWSDSGGGYSSSSDSGSSSFSSD